MRVEIDKPHFVVLDGLRGIAAIVVVWLHANELLVGGHAPVEASALAVDFFFCLSGFVVAYAYGARLDAGMSLREFATRRTIRLYPMIFLGAALGGVVFAAGALHRGGSHAALLVQVASAFVLVPAGLFYGLQAYPTNNPIWSLFFECVANLVYAMIPRRSLAFLGLLLAASAVALALISYDYQGLEFVGFNDWKGFAFGFVRVGYPFLAGVLIFRLQLHQGLPSIPAAVVVAILIITLSIDVRPMWAHNAALTLLVFPLIVVIGANSQPGPLRGLLAWLGNISYPLYLIHHPLLRMVKNIHALAVLTRHHPAGMIVASVAASCALSALIFHAYDKKIRRWAGKTFSRRMATSAIRSDTALPLN